MARFRRRGYRLGMRRRRFGGRRRPMYGRRRGVSRFGFPSRRTVPNTLWFPRRVMKSDVTISDATIDSGGTISVLTGDLGAGERRRIKYLNWRCGLSVPVPIGAAFDAPLLRVILFIDKNNHDAAPAVTDVLATASVFSSLATTAANFGRFKILSDKTFVMNAGGVGTATFATTVRRYYQKFFRFDYTAFGQESTAEHNELYCLYITSVDEVGAIDANARVGYLQGGT